MSVLSKRQFSSQIVLTFVYYLDLVEFNLSFGVCWFYFNKRIFYNKRQNYLLNNGIT